MNSKDYLHDLFGCQGRKAIVTGASSGLGAELARVLVSAGADVLAVARRRERLKALAHELQDRAGNHPCPRSRPQRQRRHRRPARASARATRRGAISWSPVPAQPPASVSKTWPNKTLPAVVDLNLKAQWLLAKACFPLLRESEAGRIVNIASIYGLGASVINGLSAYTISKHGLVGLTRSQAVRMEQTRHHCKRHRPPAISPHRNDRDRPRQREDEHPPAHLYRRKAASVSPQS